MVDFAARFKSAIEHVLGVAPADAFDDYLSSWVASLGVLSHDTLVSLIDLLRLPRVRAAYMLQRPLMDYHLRLRYYVIQARPAREQWIANNRRSVKNYLAKCDAYKDWLNAEDKLYDIVAKRGLNIAGLEALTETDRRSILKKLNKEKTILTRRISHMCEVAAADKLGSLYLENQILSGHLHGDQITQIETIRGGDITKGTLSVYWESERLKPYLILANAYVYAHGFLESIEMIRGWAYAKDSSHEQAYWRLYRRQN